MTAFSGENGSGRSFPAASAGAGTSCDDDWYSVGSSRPRWIRWTSRPSSSGFGSVRAVVLIEAGSIVSGSAACHVWQVRQSRTPVRDPWSTRFPWQPLQLSSSTRSRASTGPPEGRKS